jgi:hypothetical protein
LLRGGIRSERPLLTCARTTEYLDLERRVDGLRSAHVNFLRVAKVYDSETYDYPTQLNETVSELGGSIAHNLTFWAAAATKGANLPQPTVADVSSRGRSRRCCADLVWVRIRGLLRSTRPFLTPSVVLLHLELSRSAPVASRASSRPTLSSKTRSDLRG